MPRPSTRPEARTLDSDNSLAGSAFRDWTALRKETLLDKVKAHDVLRHFGVALKFGGSEHREQIPCPFHDDTHPSAGVYPDEGSTPSGLFCFTCFGGKRKDIFALWKAFKGDDGMKWLQVLRGLEEAFGIEASKAPTLSHENYESLRGPSEEEVDVQDLLNVCERRLRDAKSNFQMGGFMVVGQCLDRLHYRIEKKLINLSDAKSVIRKILDKISEKMRV